MSFTALLLLGGCAGMRGDAEAIASRARMQPLVLEGERFQHRAYFRDGRRSAPRELHVYVDHDGTPWLNREGVAADPTPRNPLALRLMAQDEAPSLYLGRPCHFGLQRGGPCNPLLWTHERYGEAVVASMARALRGFVAEEGFERLVLIGYSGGGALALLLADRLPQAASVVTIAGNLDVAAWTELHGYSPLAGSLDPIARRRRDPPPREFHLVGTNDANVTPTLTARYAQRFTDARVIRIEGFDHRCCWEQRWPALLADPRLGAAFTEREAARPAGALR